MDTVDANHPEQNIAAGDAEWMPPTHCFFDGPRSEFRRIAFVRMQEFWANNCECEGPELVIYAADSNLSVWLAEFMDCANYGGAIPDKPLPLCKIVPHRIQGGRCRLTFELVQGRWEDAREPVELLIGDLRRDKMFVEGGETEEAFQAAYDWWCEEHQLRHDKRSRDAFRKAMKRAGD